MRQEEDVDVNSPLVIDPIPLKNRFYIRHRFIVSIMLCISNLICYMDRTNMSIAIIPMGKQYKWSETTQSLVLSSFYYGYIATQILGGVLANKYGGKIVLYTGVAVWSCFTLLTPITAEMVHNWGPIPLLLTRAGMGLGEGINFPACNTLIGAWFPKEERTRHTAFILSGCELGTLAALFLGPLITISMGWQWTFYIFGGCGIVWIVVFALITSSSPSENMYISEQERMYITDSIRQEESTPITLSLSLFKRVLSNMGMWAIIIACMCFFFGYTIFLSFIPKIFLSIGVRFEWVGVYSTLPYVSRLICMNVAGYLADLTIRKNWASVTNVRKIMQTIAFIVPSILIFLMKFSMKSIPLSTIMLCFTIGATGCISSGALVNVLDLSPKLAGILNAILNTFSAIPGLFSNLITGRLLDMEPAPESLIPTTPWDTIFNLIIIINLIGASFYVILARGTPQFT